MKEFKRGFAAVAPLISGIIPFGAVMGTAFAEAELSFAQAFVMNAAIYAGAAQLATVELMKLQSAVAVVVTTGLVINLRFLLYSAAMAPILRHQRWPVKLFCAYTLTDQSYAAMNANLDRFESDAAATTFYLGTAACMLVTWTGAVVAGFAFGNFAPASVSLDFAVPLSFVSLLVPTLRTWSHRLVALVSAAASLLLYELPFRSGLVVTAALAIALAWLLIRRERPS